MNAKEFEKVMDSSLGAQMIITGLVELVEKEGMTARESFEFLEHVKRNTFHALNDIAQGRG